MSAASDFNRAASSKAKKEAGYPFTLRLTPAEKARLQELAGSRPVSVYIRERVFSDAAAPRRPQRRPSLDDRMATRLLGALGKSRLSSNLNQIAKAANMGALPVTAELEAELSQACAEVQAIRPPS